MTKRWMAEIGYRDGSEPVLVEFEELRELLDIVEVGPNWGCRRSAESFRKLRKPIKREDPRGLGPDSLTRSWPGGSAVRGEDLRAAAMHGIEDGQSRGNRP